MKQLIGNEDPDSVEEFEHELFRTGFIIWQTLREDAPTPADVGPFLEDLPTYLARDIAVISALGGRRFIVDSVGKTVEKTVGFDPVGMSVDKFPNSSVPIDHFVDTIKSSRPYCITSMTDWLPSTFSLYSALVLPFTQNPKAEKLVLMFRFY